MWRRSRSVALGIAAALALPPAARAQRAGATTPDTASGRLVYPEMLQQRERVTSRDDDSLVKAIEGRIHCTCGCNLNVFTCRTTDFNCATSPAMHRLVLARIDSGMTAQGIVAAFEAQFGQAVLMAPPRRGFNWLAYVMPFVGLAVGLVVLGSVMRRWVRARPAAPLEPTADDASASGEEAERLKRELERYEA